MFFVFCSIYWGRSRFVCVTTNSYGTTEYHHYGEAEHFCHLPAVLLIFMATENVPIRRRGSEVTQAKEGTLRDIRPWKTSSQWIIRALKPVLSNNVILTLSKVLQNNSYSWSSHFSILLSCSSTLRSVPLLTVWKKYKWLHGIIHDGWTHDTICTMIVTTNPIQAVSTQLQCSY